MHILVKRKLNRTLYIRQTANAATKNLAQNNNNASLLSVCVAPAVHYQCTVRYALNIMGTFLFAGKKIVIFGNCRGSETAGINFCRRLLALCAYESRPAPGKQQQKSIGEIVSSDIRSIPIKLFNIVFIGG